MNGQLYIYEQFISTTARFLDLRYNLYVFLCVKIQQVHLAASRIPPSLRVFCSLCLAARQRIQIFRFLLSCLREVSNPLLPVPCQ